MDGRKDTASGFYSEAHLGTDTEAGGMRGSEDDWGITLLDCSCFVIKPRWRKRSRLSLTKLMDWNMFELSVWIGGWKFVTVSEVTIAFTRLSFNKSVFVFIENESCAFRSCACDNKNWCRG